MSLYYFTFGQKYRLEPHPNGGHPDGWFTIEAEDIESAHARMFMECGPEWSMMYDHEPDKRLYQLGELRRITVETQKTQTQNESIT